ncbi:undecaprenyldiphospho-muramoylpentapeptide beta-N-acetylglucosaminyltransferase [Brevundimonas sp. 2R-24]|uniref:UDP-N-acetylglucosamine--N-acetylmuramyl-(pentapeptide) pyrophosphoryl-undecaprenol N-acetylglucosamine transferase n=1 Tax=Peiella sedimenti TaxID=3061083 RepID=A0ABT8SMF6_9CAUL|nr:undecaprenyldiphospho-muramoylpentapeptide beta-N-acetylglucosaminyltransferase [Caulobacteraceae bacterium XZ-24]
MSSTDKGVALLAAGGTGGHMFPAEALARELIARGWRVVLATDARGAQYAHDFPAESRIALSAATAKSSSPLAIARAVFAISTGVGQAAAAIGKLKPRVAVGFGGYPSLPGLIAASMRGVPTVIHEQNAVLGRSNRFLARRMTAVACAFPTLERADSRTKARAVVVGNPVRPDIGALYGQAYPATDGRLRILVTGGSQGARILSETVPRALAQIAEPIRARLSVRQQARQESLDAARAVYADAAIEAQVAPFFRDMAARLAETHLVIGRAGASTCSELAVAGRPALLVPLKIASDDHQTLNAKHLVDAGAAVVLKEDDVTVDSLAAAIQNLLAEPGGLERRAAAARSVAMPDAAARLADLVEATARRL